ncbi:ead/Ea22-like family protein [Escherichia coli]|nr:ead/Ea22-like family protein [Escherichia coli]
MSEIDYQALREKAEKATCGVWSLEYGEERFDAGDALIHREFVGYIPICRIEGAHPESGFDEDFQMEQQANAEFIAAANPATVLALLDERERNQQYIKRRDQENEDIALTVGKLRVELEGKDKLIAELGKQCAEWERKASSNFEECAAMAERIEELEQANTRQDTNINHQQEGVTQSVTRYIYHYNAVNGFDSMSGIARLTFMIKSQSDLEELKSALRNIGGFRAKAITSLSYLGCEEEAITKDANPNGGA